VSEALRCGIVRNNGPHKREGGEVVVCVSVYMHVGCFAWSRVGQRQYFPMSSISQSSATTPHLPSASTATQKTKGTAYKHTRISYYSHLSFLFFSHPV
jgi:hypothetical protein